MHELDMQLRRLPESERDPDKLEQARVELIAELNKVEQQLGRTRFTAGERWTMGDIAIGLRIHRWKVFDLDGAPSWPNIDGYHAEIQARPAFAAVSDPPYHGG